MDKYIPVLEYPARFVGGGGGGGGGGGVVGCCWLLLVVVGCCWLLLVVVGSWWSSFLICFDCFVFVMIFVLFLGRPQSVIWRQCCTTR